MVNYSIKISDFTSDFGTGGGISLSSTVELIPNILSWERFGGCSTADFMCYGTDYDYIFNLL